MISADTLPVMHLRAEIFEVGFNHFFHASTHEHGGDLFSTNRTRRRVFTRERFLRVGSLKNG